MEYSYTGRREDRRLVTGAGMFTADWDRPDMLHAAFLRADRAHARIVSCDVGAAQAAPGVRAVLTGADMQAAGYTRGLPLMPLGRGEALKAIDAPALALGCVRYVGEPVAIVVADSPHAAQDACELIRIDYASLPPVVGGSAALAQGAALLHAEIPGNLCYETDLRRQGRDTSRVRRRQRTWSGSSRRVAASLVTRWSPRRRWPHGTATFSSYGARARA